METCPEAFAAAYKIFVDSIPEMIRTRNAVGRSRAEVAEANGLGVADVRMKQICYLITLSQLGFSENPAGDWTVHVRFRLLRFPEPTIEEILLSRPPAWKENGDSPQPQIHAPHRSRWNMADPVRRRMTDWVFVASTWEDLKAYRDKVLWAILGQKRLPLGMEFWAPDGTRSVDRSLTELAQANLMVLIIGCRYGSPARHDDERSFIEIEYDTAKERGIDLLAFLSDPSVKWPQDVWDAQNDARLRAFRLRLERESLVYFYKSPDDLKAAVGQGLRDWDTRYKPR
jgi:hypothetical protein